MSENKNGFRNLLYAFVAGGVTGAVITMLLSPSTGDGARDKIGELLEALKETAGEKQEKEPETEAAVQAPDRGRKSELAEEIRRRKEHLFGKTDLG